VRSWRPCIELLEGRWVPSFSPAVSYPVGVGPQAVVSGDFNNDTRPDLAVATYYSTVSVLLCNTDGTFQPARNSASGSNPISLAAGDFNADGNLDLVTASAGDEICVLLGNGNGTFQAPTRYYTSGDSQSIAVGDFNADSKPDICVLSNWDDISFGNVLLGTGSGMFSAPHTSYVGQWSHYAAALADFNGDGKLDFAASSANGNVDVALGTGTGTFSYPTTFQFAGDAPGISMIAGDLNNDGKADLATMFSNWEGNNVGVLLGNGLGSFAPVQTSAADSLYGSLAKADFNADGNTDLLVANASTGMVGVMLGTGTGGFHRPITTSAGSYPKGLAVGDFNGDGWPDAATTNAYSNNAFSNTVLVLLNDGNWPPMSNPVVAINYVTVTEGNAGTVNATFTVSLSAASGQTVTVQFATTDGTATVAGNDYQAMSGTLTFAPGLTSQTVTVPINGDRLAEYNETFSVRLSNATNAFIDNDSGGCTILDDEPSVSISDIVSGVEGNTGTTAFTFTVTLSPAYDRPVSVDYATADITPDEEYWYGPGATGGIDYVPTFGTLTFAAGDTSKTITVLVNGDQLVESDEYFFVNLSNPTGASIGSSQAFAAILNDDVPLPSVSINDVSVTEGNTGTRAATFTVTLSAASSQPITVAYATANGTATAGSDYQSASGTLTIPAGQSSRTITVQVNGDRLAEPNETFFVNLSSPTNEIIADGQGQGTIVDNEPRISITDVSKKEGKKGQTTSFTFTVMLSAAYDQAVSLSFKTTDGTAKTSDSDYVAKTGTLTFSPGETTKSITIVVNGDSKKEANETFYLDLFGNSSNSLFTKNRGLGTILNDD
jgi:hypothetical protein